MYTPIFFRASLLLSLLTGLTAFAAPELKLASDPWPPFTGKPGEPRVVLDLVEEALARAEIAADIQMVGPGELTGHLREGTVQGSPALWKTTEREEYLLYSNAILENRLLLVGRKDSPLDARSLADLRNRRVGIVEGYGYGPELKQHGILLLPGRNHQENLEKLLAEELDYILVNELLIQYAILHQKTELETHIRYGDTPLLRRSLHFALRKDTPEAEKIIAAFNTQLNNMIRDGSYQRLLQLPWLEMDMDGDGKPELIYQGDRAGSEKPLRRYQPFLLESEEPPKQQYRINGNLYPSWEDVPNSLKEPAAGEAQGVLYQFNF